MDILLNPPNHTWYWKIFSKRCKDHVSWHEHKYHNRWGEHLGAVVGSDIYKVQYIEDLVDDWNTQFKPLSTIVETQPQAAYLEFANGFRSKLNYFMRTIPEIIHHLVSLEETLRNTSIYTCNNCWTHMGWYWKKTSVLTSSFWWTCNPCFFMNKPK